MTRNLLLFSNSTNSGAGYLEHAQHEVRTFLEDVSQVLFVPFALTDHDAYTKKVSAALALHGLETIGLHTSSDPRGMIASSQAIFVGGGNTFRLLATLQRLGLITSIQNAVDSGVRYMGASAGTNIAAPTIRTTNDMPIVQPSSFSALGLVPFQINPHYLDADPSSTHAGETRDDRLTEFLEENAVPVLGLREGAHLRVKGTPGEIDFLASVGGQAVDQSKLPGIVFQPGLVSESIAGDVRDLFARGYLYDTNPA